MFGLVKPLRDAFVGEDPLFGSSWATRRGTGGSDELSGTYSLGAGVLLCALAIVARGSRFRLPPADHRCRRISCGGLTVQGVVAAQRDRAIAVSVEAARPPQWAVIADGRGRDRAAVDRAVYGLGQPRLMGNLTFKAIL